MKSLDLKRQMALIQILKKRFPNMTTQEVVTLAFELLVALDEASE